MRLREPRKLRLHPFTEQVWSPRACSEFVLYTVFCKSMKFIILHGSFGTTDSNWFPWLKERLGDLGQDVILPQMPVDERDLGSRDDYMEPREQYLSNWIQFFQVNIMPQIGESEIGIIAHSISNVFTLHLVKKLGLKIDLGIFVAPFLELPSIDEKYDLVNASFYSADFDSGTMQKMIDDSYVLFGDNDEYVPVESANAFGALVGASLIRVKNGGHMYGGSGFTQFPLILELCKAHIGKANQVTV